MLMDFPYKDRFINYLKNVRLLADSTVKDLTEDVQRLFNYLRENNSTYQVTADLNQITELEIKEYLSWLQIQHQIKNSTYNKILTHLNSYFIFLFQNSLATSLPTIGMKGMKKKISTSPAKKIANWTKKLPDYLENDQLAYYTRMTLLLTAHYFTTAEFIRPDFYQRLPEMEWYPFETEFLKHFAKEHKTAVKLQHSQAIFLKERVNLTNPTLSLAGLHKILKKDQPKVDLPLKPSILYQNAILNYVRHHQNLSDEQLMHDLRLSRESLNYYRGL